MDGLGPIHQDPIRGGQTFPSRAGDRSARGGRPVLTPRVRMPAARAKAEGARAHPRSLDGRGRGDDCRQVRITTFIGPVVRRAPHVRLRGRPVWRSSRAGRVGEGLDPGSRGTGPPSPGDRRARSPGISVPGTARVQQRPTRRGCKGTRPRAVPGPLLERSRNHSAARGGCWADPSHPDP